jgi:hypothetical protein
LNKDTDMELDDMKLAWQTLDRRLELRNALDLDLYKERKFDKLKSGLRPLVFGQIVQMALGILMTVLFAPFWVQHMATPHLLVYGLSLHLYGMMMMFAAARDLHLIRGIDYSSPVLDIQKRIAELRAWHLRVGPYFAVTGCFMWTPIVLVVFYWLGADIWLHSPQFVYWLIASSVVCVAVTYGFIRWARSSRSKFARSLEDSAAGKSVTRAQAVLAEIAQFEKM